MKDYLIITSLLSMSYVMSNVHADCNKLTDYPYVDVLLKDCKIEGEYFYNDYFCHSMQFKSIGL